MNNHPSTTREPVNPSASTEARQLLAFLYTLAGRRTMSGQHNTPREISKYSHEAEEITGRAPAVWGQDFGFAANGDMDGIDFRPAIVSEAKAQYAAGAVITLMWHAVRPTEEEPVTFEGSVCRGPLEASAWRDLLTEGTEVHTRWERQVDVIAGHLAELRDAHVPVLWRPYHEMNGDWFWWCGRAGQDGYAALYRMMYERFVQVHHLDNLVWVWNGSTPNEKILPYGDCYPGHDVVDVLAVDIYANDFRQDHHDGLVALADGRPVALGEVGTMPSPAVLAEQPQWTWFMTWTDFLTTGNDRHDVRDLFADGRVLNRPAMSWRSDGDDAAS
ncbi:mannan endo-1,4-beta-mannosidase [Curtobacterium sp. PhB130]|uniref:glycosyl hydrolase n=1 Tax=unclassified Curtobacterium TaxID=257496 RepID=UPI000F4C655C|nr:MULTISPECIES: glycosyl hydrolase [unclassified Curtobacterium]ROS71852.1 mannan endo-1,4-beta-mannosidase [Curtobacterium sp. PhB130]TCK58246.1 mannan endo-1,4-beta-mannosidase [Curtobacterium sp. PhB136]